MIAEATLFIPEGTECAQIIHASQGTGDNLLAEDIAEGYCDYLNLNRYYAEPCDTDDDLTFELLDGDMILLKNVPETLEEYLDVISKYLDVRKESIVVLSAA